MDFLTYATRFFGFGRWDAPVWFVGTEEAGNPTPENFAHRLNIWGQRGNLQIEDAPAFYPAVGQNQWHGAHPVLAPTFRQLIRLILAARGFPSDDASILSHQQNMWGSRDGAVCLTELSPFPAPGFRARWPYADWPDVPDWLRTRGTCANHIRPRRLATLREKIAIHRPHAVIFYFWKPRDCAEAIADGEFHTLLRDEHLQRDDLLGFQRNGTYYFVAGHPAGGYGDAYFQKIGEYLHERHPSLFASQTPSLLEKAIRIAADAHRWAKRKNGAPYVLHPLRIMSRMKTEDEKILAALHDVIEDTHVTLTDLKREGFPDTILAALDCITRRERETYEAFIDRVASNPLSRRVKLADLDDNMNVAELPEVTAKDAARIAKYQRAWLRLKHSAAVPPERVLASIMPEKRLGWASAIGLFLTNFATLDYLLFCFLESKLPAEELAQLKRRHFKDRLHRISELVRAGNYTLEQQQSFEHFFRHLEPIREVRNHIAHGHMLLTMSDDLQSFTLGLGLPQDLDADGKPETRHLTLAELQSYSRELVALIELFQPLAGFKRG